MDAHVEGQYYLEDDGDGLAIYKCTYSAATSDLQKHLTNATHDLTHGTHGTQGPFTGYAVSLDGQCF